MPLTLSGDGSITGGTFNRPAFRVALSATANISADTTTTVPFDNEEFDTNNCFSTTNYTFTPDVAGYYYVFANVTVSTSTRPNLEDSQLQINKNNTIVAFAEIDPSDTGEEGILTNQVSVLVEMNGTTDFLIVKTNIGIHGVTVTPQIIGGNKQTFFHGFKLAI